MASKESRCCLRPDASPTFHPEPGAVELHEERHWVGAVVLAREPGVRQADSRVGNRMALQCVKSSFDNLVHPSPDVTVNAPVSKRCLKEVNLRQTMQRLLTPFNGRQVL